MEGKLLGLGGSSTPRCPTKINDFNRRLPFIMNSHFSCGKFQEHIVRLSFSTAISLHHNLNMTKYAGHRFQRRNQVFDQMKQPDEFHDLSLKIRLQTARGTQRGII